MDYNFVIGEILETARERFIETQGPYYEYTIKNAGREFLPVWIDTAKENPIKEAVKHASVKHQFDDEEILDMIEASLKFRIYAGILTRPVNYDKHGFGGQCENMEYDEKVNGWVCKVPSNQAQADSWHKKFGHSPACPFFNYPDDDPAEPKEDELHKLLNEGEDLDEIFQQLGQR